MDFPRRKPSERRTIPSALPTRTNRITENRVILNRGMIAEDGIIPTGYQFMRDLYNFKMLDKPKIVMSEDMYGKKIPIMKVTGLFQEGEKQNANGRVYPRAILAEAVKLIQEDMGRRAVYGELDHPQDAKIHMDRIAQLITKGWMDGNRIFGEAEILDNQFYGAALRGLFERKCQVGISSRGVGDMEMRESSDKKQYYEVLPGYQFVTWDAVAEPSVSGATLNVMESLRRKVQPLVESKKVAQRRNNLLEAHEYERMLVEAVHGFFDTQPISPLPKKRVKRTYSFGR